MTYQAALEQLNAQFPLRDVLGPYYEWFSNPRTGFEYVSFLRNSPAQKSEAEVALGALISSSVREGRWVAARIETGGTELAELERIVNSGGLPRSWEEAILRSNTGNIVFDSGAAYLVPTPTLAEFLRDRVKAYTAPQ